MGMTELETLKYITESPAQEDGGFHPNTVAAAKWAVEEIAALRHMLGRVQFSGRESYCQICGAWFADGHRSDCELDKLLKGGDA